MAKRQVRKGEESVFMIIEGKIYMDFAATTPVDKRVLERMLPFFNQDFGNASSVHLLGQRAEAAIEEARRTVAMGLNCQPEEVIFTSCGSESDNLALRGVGFALKQQRGANHLLISPVEHHAVSRTAEALAHWHDFEVEYLPVDRTGRVDPDEVARRLRPDTALVSVIYANNEIGTINPIAEIGQICRERGVLFHTDAVQAAAYLSVDVQQLNVDLLSLGAHKFYGPKGVGALYVRQGVPLEPQITGGGQEFGRRAGTSNTPYLVGLAEAFRLAIEERAQRAAMLQPWRDCLITEVLQRIPQAQLTGHPTNRLPNHVSFVFKKVNGNTLLMQLDVEGFACSSGSACKTGSPEPSEVLLALGLEPDWALGSLRLTLGVGSTAEEIDQFLEVLPRLVERNRATV